MEDKKIFSIQINGIKESIAQVQTLTQQLEGLDAKIAQLEVRKIGIQTDNEETTTQSYNSGGASAGASSHLTEDERILQAINKLEEQRVAYQKDIYQNYLAEKDLLKEVKADQEQIAAAERLQADSYSNTIQGLKDKLKDLKDIHIKTDISTEEFKEQTKEINQITESLKKLDKEYGQFNRSVADENGMSKTFSKLQITVAGTVQEFDTARQALRALKQELQTLAAKEDAGMLLSEEEMQRFEELPDIVMRLESTLNDAGKPMDNLMDTAQSLVGIMQVSSGIKNFFGIDNDKIDKATKDMVALMNTMQGLQKLAQQVGQNEGLMKYFNKANKAIDDFTKKIFKVNDGVKETATAEKTLAATTNQVATSEKNAAAGATVQSTATKGLAGSLTLANVAAKALKFTLATLGVGIAMEAFAWLIEGLKELGSYFFSTTKRVEEFERQVGNLGETYENLSKLNKQAYDEGRITYYQYMTEQIALMNGKLKEQISLQQTLDKTSNKPYGFGKDITETNRVMVIPNESNPREDAYFAPQSLEEVKAKWLEINAVVESGADKTGHYKEAADQLAEAYLNGFVKKVSEAQDDWENQLRMLGMALSDLDRQLELSGGDIKKVNGYTDKYAKNLSKNADEAKKHIDELVKSLDLPPGQNIIYMLQSLNSEELSKKFQPVIDQLREIQNLSKANTQFFENLGLEAMPEGTIAQRQAKEVAKLKKQKQDYIKQYATDYQKEIEINKWYQAEKKKIDDRYAKEAAEAGKAAREKEIAADNELQRLRIENMEDGLKKQIALINQEEKEKLRAFKEGEEKYTLTQEIYQKKRIKAYEDWAKQVNQVYEKMYENIHKLQSDAEKQAYENTLNNAKKVGDLKQDELYESYAPQLKQSESQGITFQPKKKEGKYDILVEEDRAYTKRLQEEYTNRLQALRSYEQKATEISLEEEEKRYMAVTAHTSVEMEEELTTLTKSREAQVKEYQEHVNKKLITQEEYEEEVEKLTRAYAEKEVEIREKYQYKIEENLKQHKANQVRIVNESDQRVLDNIQRLVNDAEKINTSTVVRNGLGFTNLKATKERNEKVIELYKQAKEDIAKETKSLEVQLQRTDLTKEQRKQVETLIERYKDLEDEINNSIVQVKQDSSQSWQSLADDIMQYAQMLQDVATQYVSMLTDMEDASYEKEKKILEDRIDLIEEYYNKQSELAEEHASNMQTLEDQIANAQGSARDRLIERYMEERQAQKDAVKEKKNAEKEKERLEAEAEKLDIKHRKEQKRLDLIQAAINTAMAISMAGINTWPLPAIPMMAAAAAMGAAQIAAIQAKEYATGGQLEGGLAQGKRHRDGGIKVLGGRAEIEGGEYIINRTTTEKNIELLSYINEKHKKVTFSELADFFTDGNLKKNIHTMSPQRHFEDGGMLPNVEISTTGNSDILNALERFASKPTVVSVQEIVDVNENMNNVRVLAGLEPNSI